MGPLSIAMLFIVVGMVATLSSWHHTLLAIHKPLGMAILVLVSVRFIVRLTHRTPPLPNDMPRWQQHIAHLSHWVFYALLFAMPLVGGSMLSAGGFSIHLFGSVQPPPILP